MSKLNPTRDEIDNVYRIVDQCSDVLAHQPPDQQGAALAVLLAMWLCGHEKQHRAALLSDHIKEMRGMMKTIQQELPR